MANIRGKFWGIGIQVEPVYIPVDVKHNGRIVSWNVVYVAKAIHNNHEAYKFDHQDELLDWLEERICAFSLTWGDVPEKARDIARDYEQLQEWRYEVNPEMF